MGKKIMFVCMGNICRSPLAEAVFRQYVNDRGLCSEYACDSSGVIGYHAGEPADSRMRQTAAKHNISITHRAQKLTVKHLQEFDIVLAMDKSNISEIKRICRKPELLEKVRLFREFDPVSGNGLEVPDPYYGGIGGFENVFEIVSRTSNSLIDFLEGQND